MSADAADEKVARFILATYREPGEGQGSNEHLRACPDAVVADPDTSDGTYGCDTGCEYVRFEATITCPHGESEGFEWGDFGSVGPHPRRPGPGGPVSADTETLVDRLRAAIEARRALAEAAPEADVEWVADYAGDCGLGEAAKHVRAHLPRDEIARCDADLKILEEMAGFIAEADEPCVPDDVGASEKSTAGYVLRALAEAYGITEEA